MLLDKDSFLVRLYVIKIKEGAITLEEVPSLYNLKEEVEKLV